MADVRTLSIEKEFHTTRRLRFAQTSLLALQLVAIFFAVYIGLSIIISGRVSFGFGAFTLGLVLWPCYGRTAWGTTIRFQDSDMTLLRGRVEMCNIPLDKIQNAKIKKSSVSFSYRLDGHVAYKTIGREGFSDNCWSEFTRYFASRIKI